METDKKKIKNGLRFWGRIIDLSFWAMITMVFITIILAFNKNTQGYKISIKPLVIVDVIPLIIFILALISYKGWKTQLEIFEETKSQHPSGLGSLEEKE